MKVIGLMSGTSVDGIDAALVEISGRDVDLKVQLLAGETYPYPVQLKEQILAVCGGRTLSIAQLAELDDAIATHFALAAKSIGQGKPKAELIGSHGQTVYHRPPVKQLSVSSHQSSVINSSIPIGYSLQLGRGEAIANLTGIPTVSNFRAADIAAGGQGAPLVSKVDAYLLAHPSKYRTIQNIGGIGNLTYLPAHHELDWEKQICGWDTGPGNALLDLAVQQLSNGRQSYDRDGSWAAKGTPCIKLVRQWLEQDFFSELPPKSTGRELFGEEYLAQCWQDAQKEQLSTADWLATLTELTVASIAHSYRHFLPQMPDEILLCGGGSRNLYLRQRLQAELTSAKVLTTDEVGVNGNFKEAIAFAVLAYWRFTCSITGNLPRVTGAKQPILLGEIHLPLMSVNN
ncbi:anhydro-N-acetylmuramic acid kinase [Pleurocapsales cyanobacterium LEGE 06147]|nr:anhydro-N-acetylmuramic acid kinase [Pleurocapsales cyanobacterium LEGE 06147]